MHDPRGIAYLYEVRYLGDSPAMFLVLVLHICAEEIPVAIGVLMLEVQLPACMLEFRTRSDVGGGSSWPRGATRPRPCDGCLAALRSRCGTRQWHRGKCRPKLHLVDEISR